MATIAPHRPQLSQPYRLHDSKISRVALLASTLAAVQEERVEDLARGLGIGWVVEGSHDLAGQLRIVVILREKGHGYPLLLRQQHVQPHGNPSLHTEPLVLHGERVDGPVDDPLQKSWLGPREVERFERPDARADVRLAVVECRVVKVIL